MTLRLGAVVTSGELINTRRNRTHGHLNLRGTDRVLVFELTGNCDPDLAGRHIRFEVPEGESGHPSDIEDPDLTGLAWQQVGPTVRMTGSQQIRVFEGSVEEFYKRSKAGDAPPIESKPALILEWHSQNGRVLVELVNPVIQTVETESVAGWTDLEPELTSDEETRPTAEALGICPVSEPEDHLEELEQEEPDSDWARDPANEAFQAMLDQRTADIDRQLGLDQSDDISRMILEILDSLPEDVDLQRDMELMDDLIDSGETGEPISSLFLTPLRLPAPDSLSEAEAREVLRMVLGQMALAGIALDMCEHFSALRAYRLLVERIFVEERGFPQLRKTQWVQHFSTAEFCEICTAESEDFEDTDESLDSETDDDEHSEFA